MKYSSPSNFENKQFRISADLSDHYHDMPRLKCTIGHPVYVDVKTTLSYARLLCYGLLYIRCSYIDRSELTGQRIPPFKNSHKTLPRADVRRAVEKDRKKTGSISIRKIARLWALASTKRRKKKPKTNVRKKIYPRLRFTLFFYTISTTRRSRLEKQLRR